MNHTGTRTVGYLPTVGTYIPYRFYLSEEELFDLHQYQYRPKIQCLKPFT